MRHTLKAVIASGLSVLTAACSPTKILNYTSSAEDYRVARDIAYGPEPRHQLDIYRSNEASQSANSCRIVFVYGGSWSDGDKNQYGFVGAELAKLGYEVVIPDYRLYPQVKHPAFIEDIALSLRYLADEQPTTQPLVIMGHSAGAMIGSMISYEPSYLAAQGLSTNSIAANIAISGPHDYFLPTENPEWANIFGNDPSKQVDGLTVNHVQKGAPASLILHGDDDTIVTPKSAESITQKLRAVGTPVTLKTYEGVGHKEIIAAIATPLHAVAPTLGDVDDYLRHNVCKN